MCLPVFFFRVVTKKFYNRDKGPFRLEGGRLCVCLCGEEVGRPGKPREGLVLSFGTPLGVTVPLDVYKIPVFLPQRQDDRYT